MCKDKKMTREEEIINKIRNLLNLADKTRNNSENEAIAAALRAQQLMAKYDIDIKQVEDAPSVDREIVRQDINFKKNSGYNTKWRFHLARVVSDNFRVKYFLVDGDGIGFYGFKPDVDIAVSVFNYLFSVGNKLSVKYYYQRQREGKPTKGCINEWLIGFCQGLKDELEKQCVALALVISEEVNQSYAEYSKDFGRASRRIGGRSYDREAFNQGRTEGRFAVKSRAIEGA